MSMLLSKDVTDWVDRTFGANSLERALDSPEFAMLLAGVQPHATGDEKAMAHTFLSANGSQTASILRASGMPSIVRKELEELDAWRERQTENRGASTASQADQNANDDLFARVWVYEEHITGAKVAQDTPRSRMSPEIPPGWHASELHVLTAQLKYKPKGFAQQEIWFWVPAHPCQNSQRCVTESEKMEKVRAFYRKQLPSGWSVEDIED